MTLSLLTPVPAATFRPRDYQIEAREAVRACWDTHGTGGQAPLLVMATGTGKTLTALNVAVRDFLDQGKRVVWLAHRKELLDQPLKDLRTFWPHITGGVVQAGRDRVHADIVFASVDTLRSPKRIARLLATFDAGHPDLVVVDEAHHSPAPTHTKAIEALRGPETCLLGLTATADREDGKDLSALWEIAYTFGVTEAIAAGFLLPPYATVSKLESFDESAVKTSGGDYDEAELGKALLLAGIVQHTVEQMALQHLAAQLPHRDQQAFMTARGRSVLVYCATVEQARLTCEALREDGWNARWVAGETPQADRDRLTKAFRAGKLEVLVNVATLTEGTDFPIASCVVLARPTRSWSLFVQILGRALRLHDGQHDGFVLDLAGATAIHSIVSAPVLIGGSRCAEAPDGVHDFKLAQAPRGACSHCNAKVSCFPGLLAGTDGVHDWVDLLPPRDGIERACRNCRSPQCGQSANGRHVWVPIEDEGVIVCVECDVERPYADAMSSMVGKVRDDLPKRVPWVRVFDPSTGCGLDQDVIVAEVHEQGMVIVVGNEAADTWRPYWLRKRRRTVRPLSGAPVSHRDVTLRAVDLLRRARRLAGPRPPTNGQHRYAEMLGLDLSACRSAADAETEITRAKAFERVVALELAAPTDRRVWRGKPGAWTKP